MLKVSNHLQPFIYNPKIAYSLAHLALMVSGKVFGSEAMLRGLAFATPDQQGLIWRLLTLISKQKRLLQWLLWLIMTGYTRPWVHVNCTCSEINIKIYFTCEIFESEKFHVGNFLSGLGNFWAKNKPKNWTFIKTYFKFYDLEMRLDSNIEWC